MWPTTDGYSSSRGNDAGGPMPSVVIAALDPRGTAAREIEVLWWLMLIAAVVAFTLVVIPIAVALRRRHGGPPGDRRTHADAQRDERTARRWMVAGGMVLPGVVVGVVLVATIDSMAALEDRDADVMTIDVIGHQWWWEVRYPDAGVVTANEVHVPAGAPVRLRLRSADVVHSFWVPELAGKLDLLPERTNEMTIDADEPGTYLGRCAEFCGLQHANMAIVVVAHDATGFDTWLADQARPAAAPEGRAAAGLETFLDRGCAGCHTIGGTAAGGDDGPDLTHVASRPFIAGGLLEPVVPDLREWITDPHAVKAGVKMPATELTAEEIEQLVAYLETLR